MARNQKIGLELFFFMSALFFSVACGGGSDCEKAADKIKKCVDALCKSSPSADFCNASNANPDVNANDNKCEGAALSSAKEILACKLDPNTCGCESSSSGTTSSTSTTTTGDTFGDTFGNTFGDTGQ